MPFREFKGVDATLQATYFSTRVDSGLIGLITYFQGIAFAAFRAADGSLTSPGNIHAEGIQLNPKAGVYTNQPVTNQGIDFGSSVAWDIMGRNSIPDIDEDLAGAVPEIGDLSTGDSASVDSVRKLSIDLQSPYTKLGQIDSCAFYCAATAILSPSEKPAQTRCTLAPRNYGAWAAAKLTYKPKPFVIK
ncbi:MAG: hypothetical protein U5L96_12195 [Owenweeksia sp.]|nr:hypothetical protein [Owenweeksia sp.]